MSLLPPPPLQAWPSMPVVWQRWFVELFRRAGTQTAGGLDELEAVVTSIPERQSQSAVEARVDSLEGQIAGLTPTNLADAAARLSDLEGQLAALTVPNVSEILKRLDALEPPWLSGSTTWDPPSLLSGAYTTQTVTVTGAVLGDPVVVSFSQALPGGVSLTGSVTAGDTVTALLLNLSAGTVDLSSGTLRADVPT